MTKAAQTTDNIPLYDRDYYAWIKSQVRALRERRIADIDFENLMDEVEDLGKSEKRALLSRFEVLQAHLLKWRYQSHRRSKSWEGTIREQRLRIADLLTENPSLKTLPFEQKGRIYELASVLFLKETGLDLETLPDASPFTIEETLDPNFWPSADTKTTEAE
ncbi:MAG: DUF29 domain-containing protein [Pseudomonadota bacterium]